MCGSTSWLEADVRKSPRYRKNRTVEQQRRHDGAEGARLAASPPCPPPSWPSGWRPSSTATPCPKGGADRRPVPGAPPGQRGAPGPGGRSRGQVATGPAKRSPGPGQSRENCASPPPSAQLTGDSLRHRSNQPSSTNRPSCSDGRHLATPATRTDHRCPVPPTAGSRTLRNPVDGTSAGRQPATRQPDGPRP
jgi:hypothetical protein